MSVKPKRFRRAASLLQPSSRLTLVFIIAGLAFGAGNMRAQNLLETLEHEMRRLVQDAKPAVVTIMATTPSEKSAGGGLFGLFHSKENDPPEVKVGSGLIVSSDGFVVTKESVVRGASQIETTLADGQMFPVERVELDSASGIAVLKIAGEKFTPAQIGSAESVQAGSWITVIGNVLGMPQAVSVGVVSAVHANNVIQISANVDPGSNGSPVFNARGQAIGIVSGRMGLGPNNVMPENYFSCTSLVYPLALYLPRLREIVQNYYETRGWLGVKVMADANDRQHLRVLSLVKDSPAERAGLQIGDVITHFTKKPVDASTNLPALVAACKPGTNETLTVMRGDSTVHCNVPIGQLRPVALQELQAAPNAGGDYPGQVEGEAPTRSEFKKIESLQINQRIQALEKELKYWRSLQQKQ
jgi:serine protease Do